MAKQLDVGVSNVARKGKKGWCGVGDKARKIKKMWIGDANGKARLFFSGGELVYHGMIDYPADKAVKYGVGLTFHDRAFFCGNVRFPVMYDKSLTGSYDVVGNVTTNARYLYLSGTVLGERAIFVGGVDSGVSGTEIDDAWVYDSSFTLTKITPATKPGYGRVSASVGDYAIFGGPHGNNTIGSEGDVYDKAFTKVDMGSNFYISNPHGCATTLDDYALFVYGRSGTTSTTSMLICFDSSLTKNSMQIETGAPLWYASMLTLGDYAILAGGSSSNTVSAVGSASRSQAGVYAIDKSLTMQVLSSLSAPRTNMAEAVLGEYALFMGGGAGTPVSAVVDIYDKSLTHSIGTPLSSARVCASAASIGEYCVIVGGCETSSVDVVSAEAYKLV